MSDSSDKPGFLQRLKDGAEATLDRAVEMAGEQVRDLEARLTELAPKLADPHNVDRLQKTMSGAARLVYGLGFSLDANARLLFEFLDWVEGQHGRRPVVEALGTHNPLLDQEFIDFIQFAGGSVSPDSNRRDAAHRHIEAYREKASREILLFLAQLASLESDQPPPEADRDSLVDYIRASGIPERFKRLAEVAHGPKEAEQPDDRSEPETESRGEDDGISGGVRRGIDALAERDPGFGEMIEAIAPLFDAHLKFLILSFLFAAQGFMTRSAIEELPEIVRQSGLDRENDDIIDV